MIRRSVCREAAALGRGRRRWTPAGAPAAEGAGRVGCRLEHGGSVHACSEGERVCLPPTLMTSPRNQNSPRGSHLLDRHHCGETYHRRRHHHLRRDGVQPAIGRRGVSLISREWFTQDIQRIQDQAVSQGGASTQPPARRPYAPQPRSQPPAYVHPSPSVWPLHHHCQPTARPLLRHCQITSRSPPDHS